MKEVLQDVLKQVGEESAYVLEVKGLSFAYPGGIEVLHQVDMRVGEGECVALLGANGCGKTTLFQHFNGLLRPAAGSVILRGKELSQWDKLEFFRRIGLVFQDPNDQLFAASVYDDVSYGPVNLGLSLDEISLRVEEALNQWESGITGDGACTNSVMGRKSGWP